MIGLLQFVVWIIGGVVVTYGTVMLLAFVFAPGFDWDDDEWGTP